MDAEAQGGVGTRAISCNKYRLVLGTVKTTGCGKTDPKSGPGRLGTGHFTSLGLSLFIYTVRLISSQDCWGLKLTNVCKIPGVFPGGWPCNLLFLGLSSPHSSHPCYLGAGHRYWALGKPYTSALQTGPQQLGD